MDQHHAQTRVRSEQRARQHEQAEPAADRESCPDRALDVHALGSLNARTASQHAPAKSASMTTTSSMAISGVLSIGS